jgi:hypothetical protein
VAPVRPGNQCSGNRRRGGIIYLHQRHQPAFERANIFFRQGSSASARGQAHAQTRNPRFSSRHAPGSTMSHRAAFGRSPRSRSVKARWKGTFATRWRFVPAAGYALQDTGAEKNSTHTVRPQAGDDPGQAAAAAVFCVFQFQGRKSPIRLAG